MNLQSLLRPLRPFIVTVFTLLTVLLGTTTSAKGPPPSPELVDPPLRRVPLSSENLRYIDLLRSQLRDSRGTNRTLLKQGGSFTGSGGGGVRCDRKYASPLWPLISTGATSDLGSSFLDLFELDSLTRINLLSDIDQAIARSWQGREFPAKDIALELLKTHPQTPFIVRLSNFVELVASSQWIARSDLPEVQDHGERQSELPAFCRWTQFVIQYRIQDADGISLHFELNQKVFDNLRKKHAAFPHSFQKELAFVLIHEALYAMVAHPENQNSKALRELGPLILSPRAARILRSLPKQVAEQVYIHALLRTSSDAQVLSAWSQLLAQGLPRGVQ